MMENLATKSDAADDRTVGTRADSAFPGNGIRTGAEYLEGLRDGREIWTKGERVEDVTSDPGIMRGAATLASFLDRQHDEQYRAAVTYVDNDGDRCAMAFQQPTSKQDVKARGRAYYEWATWSNGMFGRTPDYKNASMMAFAHATGFLKQGTKGPGGEVFARNIVDFYNHVRKHDKVLTHTLVNPTVQSALAKRG